MQSVGARRREPSRRARPRGRARRSPRGPRPRRAGRGRRRHRPGSGARGRRGAGEPRSAALAVPDDPCGARRGTRRGPRGSARGSAAAGSPTSRPSRERSRRRGDRGPPPRESRSIPRTGQRAQCQRRPPARRGRPTHQPMSLPSRAPLSGPGACPIVRELGPVRATPLTRSSGCEETDSTWTRDRFSARGRYAERRSRRRSGGPRWVAGHPEQHGAGVLTALSRRARRGSTRVRWCEGRRSTRGSRSAGRWPAMLLQGQRQFASDAGVPR